MGRIMRTIDYLDINTLQALFTAIVRPIIKYGQAVWSPYQMEAVRKMESVQHNAIKWVNGLKDISYVTDSTLSTYQL